MAKPPQRWLFFLLLTRLFYWSSGDIGSAAHYSPPYLPTACSGNDTLEIPINELFAAAGEGMWENGTNCGKQYLVRCISAAPPGTCIDQTIKIMIIDKANTSVDVTMVLSTTAFGAIASGSAASVYIEFQRV